MTKSNDRNDAVGTPPANAYSRRKQPDQVRRALIECAIRIATERGPAGVTIQAVAEAAGVTKGGLFHHFPNRQALIGAMVVDLLERLDAEIAAHMAADPEPRGSFTRAYVDAMLLGETFGVRSPQSAISVAMVAGEAQASLWIDWLDATLARHRATDGEPILEIVRFAADGAWLTYLTSPTLAPDVDTLRARLFELTR